MARGEIELSKLTKEFADVTAVDAIDLQVPAGEFFSLLGPSGCGKTTTLRMIAGFEQPTSGQILLDGTDVVYLEKIGDRMAAAVPSRVGARHPAHCSAVGKAMLAYAEGLDCEAVDFGGTVPNLGQDLPVVLPDEWSRAHLNRRGGKPRRGRDGRDGDTAGILHIAHHVPPAFGNSGLRFGW